MCARMYAWPSGCVGPMLANRTEDHRAEADEEGAGGSPGLLPAPTFTALAAGDVAETGQEVPAPGRPLSL